MSTRDLQSILLSGEVTGINLNGTTDDDQVMTKGEIRDSLQPAGIMLWKGKWASDQTYNEYHTVIDGPWLMIANKTTQQRPAPVPVGSPVYSFNVPPVFSEQAFTGVVYSGHKYTFTRGGWITEILVYAPELTAQTNYRVILIDNTIPAAPLVQIIDDPVLLENDWAKVALGTTIVAPGTEWIIIIDVLNSGGSQQVTGGWTFNGNSNAGAPTCPGGWNRNIAGDLIRICKTDLDLTDRTSELNGIITGSTIRFAETAQPANYQEFVTTAAGVDQGTYIEYACNLVDAQGTLADAVTTTMTADIPIPQSTKYVEEVDHWLTNGAPSFADVEGYVELDGVPQTGVENNAYGVGLLFQEAATSEDWDFLAYSELGGAGGGGGGGGLGTYDFTKVVGHTVTGDVYEEVARLAVTRAVGTYEFKISLTYNLNSTTSSAFIRFSTDGGATWNEFRAEPKDVTDNRAVFYAFPLSHEGGVFDAILQARKEVAANVMVIEYCDLIFEQKI